MLLKEASLYRGAKGDDSPFKYKGAGHFIRGASGLNLLCVKEASPYRGANGLDSPSKYKGASHFIGV